MFRTTNRIKGLFGLPLGLFEVGIIYQRVGEKKSAGVGGYGRLGDRNFHHKIVNMTSIEFLHV